MLLSKSQLRSEFLAKRFAIDVAQKRVWEQAICLQLKSFISDDAVVAGYFPMKGEVDITPLAQALPCVVEKNAPLVFRVWKIGDALQAGAHGSREPLAGAPVVIPDIVLVPLLAFDGALHRLGYGGGYYDRTLAALSSVQAIGIAFSCQQAQALPHEEFDRKLDAVVTEREILRL